MGDPERDNQKQAVGDLKELEIEFLFSAEHGVFCAGRLQEI